MGPRLSREGVVLYFLMGLINLICADSFQLLDRYTDCIQKLFELAGSRMLKRPFLFNSNSVVQRIKRLKRDAKRKLRIFRRVRTNASLNDYLVAKQRWNRKRKGNVIRNQERERMKIELALESKDMKVLWDQIRRITKGSSIGNSSITPGQWLRHFNRVYNVNIGQEKDTWRAINLTYRDDMLDGKISPLEVKMALVSMKNNKAPGWDGIPMEFFKHSASLVCHAFAELFNFLYENECYPKSWALSIVQPIFKKKGSPNNPDNWRGVALIPTIAKIYTKILCSRLKSWNAEKNVICDNQAGFRAGYSTGDNVFVLKTLIDASLAKRKGRLYCCFVDFRKAFDSV